MASFFVGVFATTAQDLVPIAAELAPPERRGRYVGQVMTGLILGILLSRTFAGAVAGAAGWRAVFVAGSVTIALSLLTAFLLFPRLEESKGTESITRIHASMWRILREQPELRRSMIRHGLLGVGFSAFWTDLAFFLSSPPFSWGAAKIGMMGLAGAAGVLATSVAGRVADTHGPRASIRVATLVAAASFAAMAVGHRSAIVIVLGTVAFDMAVQTSLISHQTIIYVLAPEARARINGIFVSTLFLFFALGSSLGALVWTHYGWRTLMTLCALAAVAAFGLTVTSTKPPAAPHAS